MVIAARGDLPTVVVLDHQVHVLPDQVLEKVGLRMIKVKNISKSHLKHR